MTFSAVSCVEVLLKIECPLPAPWLCVHTGLRVEAIVQRTAQGSNVNRCILCEPNEFLTIKIAMSTKLRGLIAHLKTCHDILIIIFI